MLTGIFLRFCGEYTPGASVSTSKKKRGIHAALRPCGGSFYSEKTPREVGVNLKNGYNGDLSSREAGSVGGQMVKKMVEAYEKSL